MRRLRDILWSFTLDAHRHDHWVGRVSDADPVGGTKQLGPIRNAIAVRAPTPDRALEMDAFDRVVWDLAVPRDVAQGDHCENLRAIDALAAEHPNIDGVILDDFEKTIRHRAASPEYLAEIREAARNRPGPFDLWVVVYSMDLDGIPIAGRFGYTGPSYPLEQYVESMDVISFWEWFGSELPNLQRNFERLEGQAGGTPINLGLYLYNFGDDDPTGACPRGRPLPVELMKHQCELAMTWAKAGRIAGITLLAHTVLGMGLEAAQWTCDWVAEVADESIPDA